MLAALTVLYKSALLNVSIVNGFKHSVSLHFTLARGRDSSDLQFWGVDRVYPFWEGTNRVRNLSQRKTKWMYMLYCLYQNLYKLL